MQLIVDANILLLTQRIRVFPETSYQPVMTKALALAPHRQDAPYLALAFILKAAVWSNDKGVKKQTTVTVYSTTELLAVLRKADDSVQDF